MVPCSCSLPGVPFLVDVPCRVEYLDTGRVGLVVDAVDTDDVEVLVQFSLDDLPRLIGELRQLHDRHKAGAL